MAISTNHSSDRLTPSLGTTEIDGNLSLLAQKELRLSDSDSSNYLAFKSPATVAADRTYTLPATIGNVGDVLKIASGATATAATLEWATDNSGGGSSTLTIDAKTGAYTILSTDLGKIINCTSGTFTVSLTAAATLGSGFNCWVWNTGTGAITIDPNASETIDGISTLILRQGEGTQIVCDGTNWETGDKKTMRLYAENYPKTAARPVATGEYGIAIGYGAEATGTGGFAIGGIASGSNSLAIAPYFGTRATASSTYSFAAGLNSSGAGSQAVTGNAAMAFGGSYASGVDSFAAAITNNTSTYGATGANSIAIGPLSKANGPYAIAIGWSNTAGNRSICIGGNASTASDNSVCIGSWSSTIAHAYSATLGGGSASDRGQQNRWAYGLVSSPGLGLAQGGYFVFYAQTTDATVTGLRSNSSAIGTGNNLANLSNNCAYAFSGLVIARQQASQGTATAAWKVEGLIRREASAATTTIVSQNITTINNTPNWSIAFVADTTDGALRIDVTGAAATNIRWVATLSTSEVVYA